MSNPYLLPAGNVQIAFSGGRTSAYMLHQILEANGGVPERCRVIFTNTGREMPQTLDFVQECGERWGVRIDWLEYRRMEEHHAFELVSHNSASRNGEPFSALLESRQMLPNRRMRYCSSELKTRTANRFLESQTWTQWTCAIGFRADESHRAERPEKERWDVTRWFPLIPAMVTAAKVGRWWSRQPFDLRLPTVKGKTQFGNCDGCFLKSEAFQASLAKEHPERHAWWEKQEASAATRASTKLGAQFRKEFSRRQLREFVEKQGSLIFSDEAYLCQRNDGECFA